MGWLDSIFGGGDSESTTPSPYQTIGLVTPEQESMYKKLAELVQSGLGTGIVPYTGKGVAEFTPTQLEAQNRILALSNAGVNPLYDQAASALQSALAGTPSTTINSDLTNKYYDESIYRPALKTFKEETLPMLEEGYIGTGTFTGTPREEAYRKAVRDFSDNQTSQRAALLYADEQARRDLAETAANRRITASNQATNLATQQNADAIQKAQLMASVGDVQQSLNQANLDWDYAQFLRTQPEMSPYLNLALQFLGLGQSAGAQATAASLKSQGTGLGSMLGNIFGGGLLSGSAGSLGNILEGNAEAEDWVSAGLDVAKILAMI